MFCEKAFDSIDHREMFKGEMGGISGWNYFLNNSSLLEYKDKSSAFAQDMVLIAHRIDDGNALNTIRGWEGGRAVCQYGKN